MKIKKILALIMALLMLIGTFVACGTYDPYETDESSSGDGSVNDGTGNESDTDTEKVLSDMPPYGVIIELSRTTPAIKSGTKCSEAILKNIDSIDVIKEKFEKYDFEEIEFNTIENSKLYTSVMTRGNYMVTINYKVIESEARVMWEMTYDNAPEVLKPNETTGIGAVKVYQIGTERVEEKDNPLNGMCYVVKLSNGRALVLDGGFNNDSCAHNLYNTLEKLEIAKNDDGEYIIEAWIFSHGHGDHTGILYNYAPLYADKTEVTYFVYNLPGSDLIAPEECNEAAFETLIAESFPESKRVNPHTGLKYYFGNVTISMLYTPEMLYNEDTPISYFNDTSLIFKLEADGGSVLFYGDSAEEASKAMWSLYFSQTFESDIFQMTHHGLYEAHF